MQGSRTLHPQVVAILRADPREKTAVDVINIVRARLGLALTLLEAATILGWMRRRGYVQRRWYAGVTAYAPTPRAA